MSTHTIKFARNQFNGLWRAICSCGWSDVGAAQREVQARAATHDVAWVEVPAEEMTVGKPAHA